MLRCTEYVHSADLNSLFACERMPFREADGRAALWIALLHLLFVFACACLKSELRISSASERLSSVVQLFDRSNCG